jgi:hypothetical protein
LAAQLAAEPEPAMDLEIKIKAFLEGNLTDDQLKALNSTLKDTTVTAGQGTGRALSELGGESKALTDNMRETTRASFEFGEVMRGMERGGLGGAMEALRGLRGLFRTLGPEMVAASGMMAPAIAVVVTAVMALNAKTKENKAEMQAMWDGAARRADEYKAAIEAIDKATAKMASDFEADIAEMNQRIRENIELTEEATKRYEALHAAASKRADAEAGLAMEQEILAHPEQEAEIKARYAANKKDRDIAGAEGKLLNEALNVRDVDLPAARRDINEANERTRAAQLQIDEAQRKYEDVRARAKDAGERYEASQTLIRGLESKIEGANPFERFALETALEKAKESAPGGEYVRDLQNQAKIALGAVNEITAKLADPMKQDAAAIAAAEKRIEAANLKITGIGDLSAANVAEAKTQEVAERIRFNEQRAAAASEEQAARARVADLETKKAALEDQNMRSPGLTSPEAQAKVDAVTEQLEQSNDMLVRLLNAHADAASRQGQLLNSLIHQTQMVSDQHKALRETVPCPP